MKQLLGDEYGAFAASYAQPPHVGLRVNTLKLSVADFTSKRPFALKAVGDHAPAGFLVTDSSKPGRHPYHAAGLYYLQEPSAMAVAPLLDPQPGDWVLDLAAAPGGKTTHLAALMADTGLLVANDIDGRRARILADNLVRWGTRQTLVTQAHPEQLARAWGPVFDRVLVDAPCSGEGMFRRLGAFDWSQEMVLACARRQTAVLATAAQLVRPGGRLVYATCTFAPEEDEAVIAEFLATHADFHLIEAPPHPGFSPGRPEWAATAVPSLAKTIRLWPHRFPGEGHFIAILGRAGNKKPEAVARPFGFTPPKAGELSLWRAFARAHLQIELPPERLLLHHGRLYLLPAHTLDTTGLKLVRYGLLLGEQRRGYFKPDHALALALRAGEVATAVDYAPDDPALAAYLAGHPLPQPAGFSAGGEWLLITVSGHPLGWAKASGGQLKNHYPNQWRQPPAAPAAARR